MFTISSSILLDAKVFTGYLCFLTFYVFIIIYTIIKKRYNDYDVIMVKGTLELKNYYKLINLLI